MSRLLSILANMYLNWRLHSMKHWRGLLNRYINTTANISDIRTWVNVLYICYLSKLAIPLFYTPYVHNKMVCRFDILKSWISTVDKCEVGSESCSVVQYKWNHERLVECWVVWSQSRYHQWIYHIPVHTSTTAVETTTTKKVCRTRSLSNATFSFLITWRSFSSKSAAVYKILDDFSMINGDMSIFKMAADRYLGIILPPYEITDEVSVAVRNLL